jgi:hypothetical protein
MADSFFTPTGTIDDLPKNSQQFDDFFTPSKKLLKEKPQTTANEAKEAFKWLGKELASGTLTGAKNIVNGVGAIASRASDALSRSELDKPKSNEQVQEIISKEFTPVINYDIYKAFGIEDPSLIAKLAEGVTESVPFALAPEAIITKAGLLKSGVAPFIARAGIRSGAGVGQNEIISAGKGEDTTAYGNLLAALGFAGSGAVGDILPLSAASKVNKMIEQKLPNDAIKQGNREANFPDTGSIIGSSEGSKLWDSLNHTLLSPSKKIQSDFNSQHITDKFENVKGADNEAINIHSALMPEKTFKNEKTGEERPYTISDEIKDAYVANKGNSDKLYSGLDESLAQYKIGSNEKSVSAQKARDILVEAENDALFGVSDPALKKDIIDRANATLKSEQKPLDYALKEYRITRDKAFEEKAKGNLQASKHYNDIASSYRSDIEGVLAQKSPETLKQWKKADDYFHNNIVPFRESTKVNKLINNTFDEAMSPMNIATSLTNGEHKQLLSILPKEAKARMLGDLLFSGKRVSDFSDAGEVGAEIAKNISKERFGQRIEDIAGELPMSRIKEIAKKYARNNDVLGTIKGDVKKVGGKDGDVPMDKAEILNWIKNTFKTPTAPFYTRLLDAKKNPALLEKALAGEKITPSEIMKMQKGRGFEGGAPVLAQNIISQLLSKPNATRIPADSFITGLQSSNNEGK